MTDRVWTSVTSSVPTVTDLDAVHSRIDREATACQGAHRDLAGRVDAELEEVRDDLATLAGNARAGLLRVLVIAGGVAVVALLGDVALAIALVVTRG